jgi:glycosyltransferase involved in cell wall biosynthesis
MDHGTGVPLQNISQRPEVSLIVPVFNEERAIEEFYFRSRKALDRIAEQYEIIFVDDGSIDKSRNILKNLHDKDRKVKILRLDRNFGQPIALLAGFKYAQGHKLVTMDVDLQCAPEDIHKLIEKIDQGFDAVYGYREYRQDPAIGRCLPSFFMNKFMSWRTGVKLRDWGCSFCATRGESARHILSFGGNARFIKPLAVKIIKNFIEVGVTHKRREKGKTKYNYFRLVNSALDFLINYNTTQAKSDKPLFLIREILG